MKCEFCHEEIAEGVLACPRCGSPVSRPAGQKETTGETESAGPEYEQPLAKVEEDFIALAEEAVEETEPKASSPLPHEMPYADLSAFADKTVPPGAHVEAQPVQLDDSLTGGYKGDSDGPSVGGAGQQTAADPFGLDITETAPPVSTAEKYSRPRRTGILNLVKLLVSLVIAAGAVFAAVYLGFLREKGPDTGAPAKTLQEFVGMVIGSDSRVKEFSTPGSSLAGKIFQLIAPYEREGVVSIKDFDAETVSMSDKEATARIDKFEITVLTTSGEQTVDVLEIKDPLSMPRQIKLMKNGDNWLVAD